MTQLALARKYRPKNFQQLVGQVHVSQALSNALRLKRLHHAYLFTGTRGIGKTTIARILAKSLNCEQGISETPCGQCDTCQEIDQGRFVDLIEIDAASRTKVEDTREILDNVQYTPTRGRYKVYLIDEVHMLSNHSFNALLKTLEEPPEHVVFLLATTDPQKLPITVLSRCLQFYLKKLPNDAICQQLASILDKENCQYQESALKLLAKAAKGSMRDALSLTDQAIAFSNNNINEDNMHTMLGSMQHDILWQLINDIHEQDGKSLLTITHKLNEQGCDFEQALDELITLVQSIAIYQAEPSAITDDTIELEKIAHYANTISKEDIQLYYQILLIGKRDLALSPNSQLGFEMLMIRIVAFTPDTQASTPPPSVKKKLSTITNSASEAPKKTPAPNDGEAWLDIINKINVSGITKTILEHTSLTSRDDNTFRLLISPDYSPMINDKHITRIEQALSEYRQNKTKVLIKTGQAIETPAEQKQQKALEIKVAAIDAIQSDDNIKTLMSQFGATLNEKQIKPKEQNE